MSLEKQVHSFLQTVLLERPQRMHESPNVLNVWEWWRNQELLDQLLFQLRGVPSPPLVPPILVRKPELSHLHQANMQRLHKTETTTAEDVALQNEEHSAVEEWYTHQFELRKLVTFLCRAWSSPALFLETETQKEEKESSFPYTWSHQKLYDTAYPNAWLQALRQKEQTIQVVLEGGKGSFRFVAQHPWMQQHLAKRVRSRSADNKTWMVKEDDALAFWMAAVACTPDTASFCPVDVRMDTVASWVFVWRRMHECFALLRMSSQEQAGWSEWFAARTLLSLNANCKTAPQLSYIDLHALALEKQSTIHQALFSLLPGHATFAEGHVFVMVRVGAHESREEREWLEQFVYPQIDQVGMLLGIPGSLVLQELNNRQDDRFVLVACTAPNDRAVAHLSLVGIVMGRFYSSARPLPLELPSSITASFMNHRDKFTKLFVIEGLGTYDLPLPFSYSMGKLLYAILLRRMVRSYGATSVLQIALPSSTLGKLATATPQLGFESYPCKEIVSSTKRVVERAERVWLHRDASALVSSRVVSWAHASLLRHDLVLSRLRHAPGLCFATYYIHARDLLLAMRVLLEGWKKEDKSIKKETEKVKEREREAEREREREKEKGAPYVPNKMEEIELHKWMSTLLSGGASSSSSKRKVRKQPSSPVLDEPSLSSSAQVSFQRLSGGGNKSKSSKKIKTKPSSSSSSSFESDFFDDSFDDSEDELFDNHAFQMNDEVSSFSRKRPSKKRPKDDWNNDEEEEDALSQMTGASFSVSFPKEDSFWKQMKDYVTWENVGKVTTGGLTVAGLGVGAQALGIPIKQAASAVVSGIGSGISSVGGWLSGAAASASTAAASAGTAVASTATAIAEGTGLVAAATPVAGYSWIWSLGVPVGLGLTGLAAYVADQKWNGGGLSKWVINQWKNWRGSRSRISQREPGRLLSPSIAPSIEVID